MANYYPVTLQDQIEHVEDLEISYRTLHTAAILSDFYSQRSIQIPYSSITMKYINFLNPLVITYKLTPDDQVYYRYQPKKFSNDVYGTTEFWPDILILNHCVSLKDFNLTEIKTYDPNELKTYLNEIMIVEQKLGNIDF